MTIRKLSALSCAAAAVSLALTAGTGTAAARIVPGVPWYHQQLRNDCEAASLRMVLAARGVYRSDWAILGRMGVDRAHYRFGHSGRLSGDPYRAFVGNPDGSERAGTGFGIYAPALAAAARSYGLNVLAAGQGISPARLRAEVSRGHPAVVWTDYLWRRLGTRWYTAYDGRRVPYAGPNEHTVVVTGFSHGRVTVADPTRGRYTVSLSTFEAGYHTYRDMAVIVA